MNQLSDRVRLNSLKDKDIPKAEFVKIKNKSSERFKYFERSYIVRFVNKRALSLKRKVNSIVQRTNHLIKKVDWPTIGKEFSLWSVEAFVEGVAWNFAMFALFKFPFTIVSALAYGVLIKQVISLYWRLKKDGSTTTLFATD